MLLLGIDLGTSSIKVAVVDAQTQQTIASASYPEQEAPIVALQKGWAEQDPLQWWSDIQQCILKANASGLYNPKDIAAIGIAYQMHGLVMVDAAAQPLRNSIIWCDSRAVPYGDAAFDAIGHATCLQSLYNSPGNFTAAKLAWVKEHEPHIYAKAKQIMLPGDFAALQMTGEASTTASALSEGIIWDFEKQQISDAVMHHFGFDRSLIPSLQPVFATHGRLLASVAATLGLTAGIPVTYKAGDQPNNALSLNVMQPGDVATTAGTSGVIYGVAQSLTPDPQSRLNCFAHANHSTAAARIGLLLCINGCGIMNKLMRQWLAPQLSYDEVNQLAAQIPAGSEGVRVLPFGNGAERMLGNRQPGAQILQVDANKHQTTHVLRATQEGIAFAFRYGLDIMRSMGMHPQHIKAGLANMFQSAVFTHAFVNSTGVPVSLYNTDGATGAALGAGIGAGAFAEHELGAGLQLLNRIEPTPAHQALYEDAYLQWRSSLEQSITQ